MEEASESCRDMIFNFFFPLKSVHEHKVGLRTIFVLKKSEESSYSEKTDG